MGKRVRAVAVVYLLKELTANVIKIIQGRIETELVEVEVGRLVTF